MRIPTLILASILFGLAFGVAKSTERVTHDGVWWQSLTRDEKITAVEVMSFTLRAGYSEGVIETCSRLTPRNVTSCYRSAPGIYTKDITFGSMATRFDLFYEDHPAMLTQPIEYFEICVLAQDSCDRVVRSIR